MNYYKHHIGDYRRDTSHLSLLEHGIYRQLMDTYYLSEEPIPIETKQVMRRLGAGTPQECEAVNLVLSEFFLLVDGAWKHTRCDIEIAAYHKRAETSAANGKSGGRPPGKPSRNRTGSSRVPSGKATTNHKPITNISPIPPEGYEWPGFTAFWQAWPTSDRKQARGKCLEAWKKANAESVAALVLAHVQRMKASAGWTKQNGEFIPAPLVYLNRQSWDGAEADTAAEKGFV